jgi:hypothetical protein
MGNSCNPPNSRSSAKTEIEQLRAEIEQQRAVIEQQRTEAEQLREEYEQLRADGDDICKGYHFYKRMVELLRRELEDRVNSS